MSRFYDYRCRGCGAVHAELADKDPGPMYVCSCPQLTRYWRSRPEQPFVQRDLSGIKFGPSDAELAETGRPHARIRDDADSMTLREPERPMPEHVQGKLF